MVSPEFRLGIGESAIITDYRDSRVKVHKIHLLFGTAVYILLWEVREELACLKS